MIKTVTQVPLIGKAKTFGIRSKINVQNLKLSIDAIFQDDLLDEYERGMDYGGGSEEEDDLDDDYHG